MESYSTPVLNQMAFGVGFGTIMFWPVWLLGLVLGLIAVRRGERRFAALLLVGTAIPPAISAMFYLLVQNEVDVGSAESLAAQILNLASWVFIWLTGLSLLASVGALVRWSAVWLQSRARGAHV